MNGNASPYVNTFGHLEHTLSCDNSMTKDISLKRAKFIETVSETPHIKMFYVLDMYHLKVRFVQLRTAGGENLQMIAMFTSKSFQNLLSNKV